MELDNILQLNVLQKIKDKGIKLYSYDKDDYDWESMIPINNKYRTYKELNNDKNNDGHDIGYFLKTDAWYKWRHTITKQEENCAAICAHVHERFDKKWQVRINIDCKIEHSMNDSLILFNTRDEAAKTVQKWFDTYIFEDKYNNADHSNELSQNNDLLDRICNMLG